MWRVHAAREVRGTDSRLSPAGTPAGAEEQPSANTSGVLVLLRCCSNLLSA